MNNYEKIKNMSFDEMVTFLTDSGDCDVCTCDMEEDKCLTVGCSNGIRQWLQQESEK